MTHTTDSIPENAIETNDRSERRKRLREFQSGLVERVQAARSNTDAAANQLGVMIGQTCWLIDLQEVGEIVSVESIAKVPLTRDWYLGLASLHACAAALMQIHYYLPDVRNCLYRIILFQKRQPPCDLVQDGIDFSQNAKLGKINKIFIQNSLHLPQTQFHLCGQLHNRALLLRFRRHAGDWSVRVRWRLS